MSPRDPRIVEEKAPGNRGEGRSATHKGSARNTRGGAWTWGKEPSQKQSVTHELRADSTCGCRRVAPALYAPSRLPDSDQPSPKVSSGVQAYPQHVSFNNTAHGLASRRNSN